MNRGYQGYLTLGFALCVATLGGCATGPEPFVGGELLVMVYSTEHAPVTGAELRHKATIRGRSDSFGRIIATGLPAGDLRLLLSAPGYAPKEVSFTFVDPTQILYVSLEPLGLFCGEIVEGEKRTRLEEAMRLQELSAAPLEERLLLRGLHLHLTGQEDWVEELEKLRDPGGSRRANALIRLLRERQQ